MLELILKTPIEKLTNFMIEFNNEEILKEISPKIESYRKIVYTEHQLPMAKADRADLNKFVENIEDWRKKIKKACLAPYEKFEAQVKEITGLVNQSVLAIDTQIKRYEEQTKQKKRKEIEDLWDLEIGNLKDLVPIDSVFKEQWLNVTFSISKVQEEIIKLVDKVQQDLAVIETLKFKDEKILKVFYLKSFDLTATLQEKARLEESEKKLAEFSEKQTQVTAKITGNETVENKQEELKQVDFRIWATKEQLQRVKAFLVDNNIKYGGVPQKEES